MKSLLLCLVVVAFCIPVTGFAQNPLPNAGAASGTHESAAPRQKTTTYDFRDEDIESQTRKSGLDVQGEPHGKTSSLIKIRSSFVSEIVKSVEGI